MNAIRVHGWPHLRAALEAGRALARPVTVVSPREVAAFAGLGWWKELLRQGRAAFPDGDWRAITDCGDAPGQALTVLGDRDLAPWTGVWIEAPEAVTMKLKEIAQQIGSECGGKPGGKQAPLDLLGEAEAGPACRAWLLKEGGCRPSTSG